ncbi:hypothetical protein Agub_g11646, partial [Astrephomene gubernaculifera]
GGEEEEEEELEKGIPIMAGGGGPRGGSAVGSMGVSGNDASACGGSSSLGGGVGGDSSGTRNGNGSGGDDDGANDSAAAAATAPSSGAVVQYRPPPPPALLLAKSRGRTLVRRNPTTSHPSRHHPTTTNPPATAPSNPSSHRHHRFSTSSYHHHQTPSASSPNYWLLPQPLYIAVPTPLLCRLALCPPLKSLWVAQVSSLDAPTGRVSVAFLKVVGAATLLADLPGPAAAALEQCQRLVCGLLGGAGGYLVEGCGNGLVLAAFGSPAAAAEWALDCVDGLKRLDWDPALLSHELCEEVVTLAAQRAVVQSVTGPSGGGGTPPPPQLGSTPSPAPAPAPTGASLAAAAAAGAAAGGAASRLRSGAAAPGAGGAGGAGAGGEGSGAAGATAFVRPASVALSRQATTLSRGLRIKVGIDVGFAACSLTATSGRLSYRGRVMNRAARIAGIAAAGQVLCSGAAWEGVTAEALRPPSGGGLPPCLNLSAVSLGPMVLKGIKEPLEVLQCVRDEEGHLALQLQLQQQQMGVGVPATVGMAQEGQQQQQ